MDRLLGIREAIAAVAPLGPAEIDVAGDGRHVAADATARVAPTPATCSAMDDLAIRAAGVAPPCAMPVVVTMLRRGRARAAARRAARRADLRARPAAARRGDLPERAEVTAWLLDVDAA